MAARAYGRETIATLPIDDDKDWKNREISNVKNLGVNEHITLLARNKKRNVYPALNRYDSETDGWYVSKDNNDIERKFWKDDFSVDSSENWVTDVGTVTVDTVNKKLVYSGVTPGSTFYLLAPSNAPVSPRKLSYICNIDPENVNNTSYRYIHFYIGSTYIGEFRRQNNSTEYNFQLPSSSVGPITGFVLYDIGTYEPDTHVEFVIGEDNIICGYLNGVLKLKGAVKSGIDLSGTFTFRIRVSNGSSVNFEFKDVTVSPSISYSDDFTTDTVSRTALAAFSTLSGSVEVANEYASRYTGV